MTSRHKYRCLLPAPSTRLHTLHPTGGALRNPLVEETEALAELILDAYRNTIDSEGETTDDALEEINRFFGGKSGAPLLDASWMYASGDTILSASLITLWQDAPLLSYLMTRATWKDRGLAQYVLRQSLLSLQDRGYTEVYAFVTEGNQQSEHVLAHFGFERVPRRREVEGENV